MIALIPILALLFTSHSMAAESTYSLEARQSFLAEQISTLQSETPAQRSALRDHVSEIQRQECRSLFDTPMLKCLQKWAREECANSKAGCLAARDVAIVNRVNEL